MSRRYVQIRNWDTHQAYTANRPSWIKLHVALRDDPDFTELPDEQKAHVIGLWMLAASAGKGGKHILRDSSWIAGVIRATSRVDIESLERAGFVTPCTCESCTSASRILDNPQESSTVEERRGEEKREEEKELLSADADVLSGRAVGGTQTKEDRDGEQGERVQLADGDQQLGDHGGDDLGDELDVLRGDHDPVEEVLAHFDTATGRRLQRLPGRRQKVRARLKRYTVEDLKRAADSAAANPFYRGENKHGTRYDRPETVYRSDETVERHLEWLSDHAVTNGGAFDHLD